MNSMVVAHPPGTLRSLVRLFSQARSPKEWILLKLCGCFLILYLTFYTNCLPIYTEKKDV